MESKKGGHTLKINEDKGIFTIQTDDIALQAIFGTPILEVSSYL